MLIAFKILLFLGAILSLMGSLVEKDAGKQKVQLAIFIATGLLFLLAEIGGRLV